MSDLQNSKRTQHEPEMTRRYAERIGGTLLLEYLAVPGDRGDDQRPGSGRRLMDGIIVPDGKPEELSYKGKKSFPIEGLNVIVVQTKRGRLSLPLLGQALFSRLLVKQYCKTKHTRTVALCGRDDEVLHPLAKRYKIEVVVDKDAVPLRTRRKRARVRKQRSLRRS